MFWSDMLLTDFVKIQFVSLQSFLFFKLSIHLSDDSEFSVLSYEFNFGSDTVEYWLSIYYRAKSADTGIFEAVEYGSICT